MRYGLSRAGLAALAAVTACVPAQIHQEPVIAQNDRVESVDATVAAAGATAGHQRWEAARSRDSIADAALAGCAPQECDAIARGEVILAMDQTEVMAATRTTWAAWSVRQSIDATVMVPATLTYPPRDATGELAMVQLRRGSVSLISYREPQGLRVVSQPGDATLEGRADAVADLLMRQGDELAAAGDLDGALDRYDRADVLRPADPLISYRIATVLDKQLRPIEALVQYQLFLHRLELERIEAKGDAAAKLAEAIALAQQRIVILERQTR